MTTIERLIDDANPILDPRSEFGDDDIRALLTLTLERNADMDMKELTKPVEREPKRGKPWIVAAAFAAVVVLVGGALVLFTSNDSDAPPVTEDSIAPSVTVTPDSDEPVMTEQMLAFIAGYEAAYESGDADAFGALLAPGAVRVDKRSPELAISAESMTDEMVNLHSRETTVTLTECVPAESSMTCTTTFDGPVEQALFRMPITSRDTFIFDTDGKLVKIEAGGVNLDTTGVDNFRGWMEVEHPEIHAQMILAGFQLLAYADAPIYLEWAPVWAELGRPAPSDEPELTEAMLTFISDYVAAFNDRDPEAFEAMYAAGATRAPQSAPDLQVDREFLLAEATNLWLRESVISLSECVPTDSGVSCLMTLDGPVEQALYGTPIVNRHQYSVDGTGSIVSILMGPSSTNNAREDQFIDWLTATHPDVADDLVPFSERGLVDSWAWSDAALYLEWAPVWADLGRP